MWKIFPFIKLYKHYSFKIILGILLAIFTLLASIFLLSLSGWFLAASALAGFAGLYAFNYMLPAAGVRGGAIIRTASRYAERLVSHDATFRILTSLRLFTFQRIFPLSIRQLSLYRQADLLNRFINDIDTLDHLYLRLISPIISALFIICITFIVTAYFSLKLAFLLSTILLLTLLILPLLFYFLGKKSGYSVTIQRMQYRQQLTHLLQANAELTLFGAAHAYREKLDNLESVWFTSQKKQMNLVGLSVALLLFIAGMTAILIVWLAADIDFNFPYGKAIIALFLFLSLSVFESLAMVPNAFLFLGQVIASAQRVSQLLDQKPDMTFGSVENFGDAVFSYLSLEHITFCYPQQLQPALNNISLQLQAGQHIAILGKTGCGKSTLLSIISRMWQIKSGQITINHLPLEQLSEQALRNTITVVPQRSYIFSATLRQNLLLANEAATDAQLVALLQQVELNYLLENDGLDQWLGEGGRMLSGGELRRISIARALLKQAAIILLDEPTEGLDNQTEKRIVDLIHHVCQNATLIYVSHRLYGIERFDQIYVMNNGQFVEQGTHHQLLTKNGYYSQLIRAFDE